MLNAMFSGFFLAALSVMLTALAIEDLHRNAVSGAHLTAVSVWVITGHAADMVMGGPDIWPVSLRAGTEAGIVMLAGAVIWGLVMGRLTGRLPLGGADILENKKRNCLRQFLLYLSSLSDLSPLIQPENRSSAGIQRSKPGRECGFISFNTALDHAFPAASADREGFFQFFVPDTAV